MVDRTPIAGSMVRLRLQQAVTEADARLQHTRNAHDELGRRLQQLLARRNESFSELARAQLPALTEPNITNVCETARTRIVAAYQRHEQVRRTVSERLATLEQTIVGIDQEVVRLQQELSALGLQRSTLERQVAQQLAADLDFQTTSHAALAAETALKRNEERLRELQQEAQAKLPAYNRSTLFQYLYRRGYRRSSQAAATLTGRLDRWVARLIDFDSAVRSYDFLRLTPPRMLEELQRRQSEFDQIMAKLESIRDAAGDACGLDRVVAEVTQRTEQRNALAAQIERHRSDTKALRAEQQQLEAGQGRFHVEALQALQQILSETRTEILEHSARQSPTDADDRVVAEIAALTADLARLRPQAEASDSAVREAETLREEVVVALRRFDDNAWSAANTSFDASLDLDGLTRGLTSGQITRHEVSQRLQRAVRVEPSAMEQSAQAALAIAMAPETRVLAGALLEVAGAVLASSATRSVQRRSASSASGPSFHDWSPPVSHSPPASTWSAPSPPSAPAAPTSSGGDAGGGRFTSGDGF